MAELPGGEELMQLVALAATEAYDAAGFGLSTEEMLRWEPFRPIEVYWARKHRLTVDTARRWAAEGFALRDAVSAVACGLQPEDLRPWVDAGFLPSDGIDAAEACVPLDTAIAWWKAGFILPDALLLIDEGWTLEAATAARYADSGPPSPGSAASRLRPPEGGSSSVDRRSRPRGGPPPPGTCGQPVG